MGPVAGEPSPPEDTISFDKPRRRRRLPRPIERRRGVVLIVAAALVVGAAAGAGVTALLDSGPAPRAAAPRPTVVTTIAPEPVVLPTLRVPARVDPRSSYTSSCQAELSSSPDGGSSAHQFVAQVSFDNQGNVGLSYRVTATWYLLDSAVLRRSVERDVPPHTNEQASLSIPATAEQVAANRALRDTARCSVHIMLTHTFGDAYR